LGCSSTYTIRAWRGKQCIRVGTDGMIRVGVTAQFLGMRSIRSEASQPQPLLVCRQCTSSGTLGSECSKYPTPHEHNQMLIVLQLRILEYKSITTFNLLSTPLAPEQIHTPRTVEVAMDVSASESIQATRDRRANTTKYGRSVRIAWMEECSMHCVPKVMKS
jgi:hypothetical protein